MLHSLPSEEELGAALPGKFWVTCLFLGQSTAARGWDILIGLLGHLVPSWTNHLAQEDTMLSLATTSQSLQAGVGGSLWDDCQHSFSVLASLSLKHFSSRAGPLEWQR